MNKDLKTDNLPNLNQDENVNRQIILMKFNQSLKKLSPRKVQDKIAS